MPLSPAELANRIATVRSPIDAPVRTWHGASTQEAPLTLTYQFATSQPGDLWAGFGGWTAFTEAQKTAVRNALAAISEAINVNFVETTGAADPDFNFGRVNLGTGGQGGFSYSYTVNGLGEVTSKAWDGYAVFNNTLALTDDPNLILHEIGHALGLKHPGNYDAGGELPPPPFLPANEDNNKYSVMSYNAHPNTGGFAERLMVYDIAALQAMWGADFSTRSGNTVYFGPGSDPAFALANGQTMTVSIWDGGGTDRIDASNQTSAVVIDLNAGAFSSIGPIPETISIAYGVRIENASGGSGHDALSGNAWQNRLVGNSGNDLLYGRQAADTLQGDAGDDNLNGGSGADRHYGGSGRDTASYSLSSTGVTANLSSSGSNTGEAAGDTYLSIENLLGSSHNDILVGSSAANRLVGGAGADTLTGASGRDTLSGGLGSDRFDFNSVIQSPFGANRDIVTDFNAGTAATFVDRIDLLSIDARTDVGGNQAFTFIGSSAFSGTSGELRVHQVSGNTSVLGDVNGDGAADLQVTIDNVISLANLTAIDFVL